MKSLIKYELEENQWQRFLLCFSLLFFSAVDCDKCRSIDKKWICRLDRPDNYRLKHQQRLSVLYQPPSPSFRRLSSAAAPKPIKEFMPCPLNSADIFSNTRVGNKARAMTHLGHAFESRWVLFLFLSSQ